MMDACIAYLAVDFIRKERHRSAPTFSRRRLILAALFFSSFNERTQELPRKT